jgi:glycosyltransferase involved in cell wall biosynthesis
LGEWLATRASFATRWISHALLGRSDLSLVLSRYNQADAERLRPRRIAIVPNGIPDPCPGFTSLVRPRRLARLRVRQHLTAGGTPGSKDWQSAGPDANQIKVLFLAHCTREKGLFDTLAGVAIANQTLSRQRSKLEFVLTVAGTFPRSQEQAEFEELIRRPEWKDRCRYAGFLAGEAKHQALLEADVFCFPTFYQNEGQPVNIIEALAFGLPVVATRWRALPELLPAGYPGLVEPHQPAQLAEALLALAQRDSTDEFRRAFLAHFTCEQYWASLASAVKTVFTSGEPNAGQNPPRPAAYLRPGS